ncbi:MAG: rhomboid family intramembrane serine protease [Bacteroidia bacterium]
MITLIIIVITVAVSLICMDNETMKGKLMFNAYMIHKHRQWYRLFSSGIIHADWMHLAFNMYSLYIFGKTAEAFYFNLFGAKGILLYIVLYVSAIAMASFYSYEKNKNNIYYNALGASGAVSAIIFAFIIIAPKAELGFVLLPGIDIPAYLFGLIFLGIEYYLGKRGQSNIGHDAHFWGAIYGAVFTIALKPSLVSNFIQQITGY